MSRKYQHIVHGVLAAVLLRFPKTRWLGIAWILSFLGYEVYQDDETADIKSYLYGFGITAALLAAVNLGRKAWRCVRRT